MPDVLTVLLGNYREAITGVFGEKLSRIVYLVHMQEEISIRIPIWIL